ncbi:MAG: EVE domain-containing protein, partial [Phycisphaerae bacterium]|nr:EVE domain-containing protein [Phycisphaerae bacterium]
MANYWLVKSEPTTYSIAHLKRDGTSGWEGSRNYQSRNTMRDLMKPGDRVLFYHSNTEPIGLAGVAVVAGSPRPDPTQWNAKSDYFDATSPRDNPRWMMVDLKFERAFDRVLGTQELRAAPELRDMIVLKRGNRLSVTPVTAEEF